MIKRSLDAIEGNVIEFHVHAAKSTVSNVQFASALNESVMMGIDIDGLFFLSVTASEAGTSRSPNFMFFYRNSCREIE